jgi:FMN phosphatase YigB (HAD superfamily)
LVYVVDLDDTLVSTKNLNNDAYNFALENNGRKRLKTGKRLTRENLGGTPNEKIITDKQKYFAQKWLKYRVVVNEEILSILQNQNRKDCYLWTSADKNRADYILKELDLYKYFNKVIYDDKKDLNSSLKRLKDITKSNVFLIFEDNENFFKKTILRERVESDKFKVKKCCIKANDFIT